MVRHRVIVFLAVLLCSSMSAQAYNEGAFTSSADLCSNIEVREVASNINYNDVQRYAPKKKRASIWFGPRMGKRDPHTDAALEDQMSSIPEEVLNNVHVLLKRELEEKLGPDSQWLVYLVNGERTLKDNLAGVPNISFTFIILENPNKYMTPRMGRELGERCLELHMVRPPMGPRMGRNLYSMGG